MRPFLPLAAVLTAAFLLGCQDQGSEPVGPESVGPQFAAGGGPQLAKKNCKGTNHPPPCGDGGDDGDGETFDVTVRTVAGPVWTDEPQTVQSSNAKNWLHVFDSGGNGTRGRPNYANAAFSTRIFFEPDDTPVCVGAAGLFNRLDEPLRDVVFDFQVSYDIADNPKAFSFFLFRWQDGDQIFSASTGFGSDGSAPAPTIVFLGNPDDIDNPAATRVFRISEAKVIVQELDKNKVISMLECDNDQIFEVTVAPST